jgi:hypothetical protein
MNPIQFAKRYGVAAAGALYAFTLGLRAPRHRALLRQIAHHFGYSDHPPFELPRVRLESLVSTTTSIVLPVVDAVEGNVSLLELVAIAKLVAERRPDSIFEIGTFDGRTSVALAANAPGEGTVFTLDLPKGSATRYSLAADDVKYVEKLVSGARLSESPHSARVRQLYGDSATFDFGPYNASFVFVDGSHAYDYVMSDSRQALRMLGQNSGTIVWHDYGTWEGVTVALNALRREASFATLRHIEGTSLAILDVAAKNVVAR